MKRILLLLTLLLATSSLGWAGACSSSTLDIYMASGFSCSVGDKVFSNFTYVSSASGGAAAVPASGVAVTPVMSGFGSDIGLLFSAAWIVGSNQTQDSLLTYTVTCSGCSITDLMLVMVGGSTPNGTGGVAETATGPGGLTVGLNTFTDPFKPSDSKTFAGVGFLNLSKDIGLSGGTSGAAHISGVYNLFSETAVPEPASMLLFGTGLLALGGYIRRRQR